MNYKKIINNIKKNIDFKDLIFFSTISIIFFGVLINMEYATDTYSVFTDGARQDIIHFLGSGRFITAFATAVARILQLSELQIYIMSYAMAIIFLVISLYEINKINKEDIKNKIISKIISILLILNIFIIELFLFIEKGILIFSILMNVFAIKYIIRFLKDRNKKDILKVLLFMFLANGSYQGTVGLFVAVTLIYIIKYSKNIKDFIINNVITALCYAVPAILDLIIAKLFSGDRVSGNIILSESLSKVINSSKDMLFAYNIIPKYIFPVCIILLIIATLYKIITSKQETKNKVIQIFSICYIIISTYIVTVFPQLIQNTASIWMVPRSTYTFASLIGILMLFLYISFPDINMTSKIIKNLTISLSIVFIFLQFYNFTKIEISRYKLNVEDEQICMQIIDKINKYEEETGKTISNIAVYQDKNIMYTYRGLFITGDLNIKAFASDWATKAILNYYSHRSFTLVEKDENIENNFKEKNWDIFDEEQLIFIDDTLHICCY